MAFAPGARVGPYEVIALIGQGGMGEVHRANDTNLGRQVAIKVLPDIFASDPERLARFEREARTLAALNHPNIAVIYGLEKTDGGRALVMELVEGPTLADRLAAGPIPIDESLDIARQIAEALEAAHDHGIIHRDLKPANVKVRTDGTVKVLDFGLAKMPESAAVISGASLSPTITTPAMTRAGVILGTAAYMSPEQARGKPVDRRADIWAFGCALFEMLAGRRPFPEEETVSDTIAGILKGEPTWTALPADMPPAMRALIERCLKKDVRHRLSHIAEARIAIEEAATAVVSVPQARTAAHRSRRFLLPAVTAVASLAAVALAARLLLMPEPERLVTRFDIVATGGASATAGGTIDVGEPISPDGRTVIFLAPFDGRPSIWIRPLDSTIVRPLAKTEYASRPVWSPDSRSLAFFSEGQLKRIAIAGGPATPIVSSQGRDAAWGPQNVLLIGGQRGKPLMRVAADGGEAMPVTTLADGDISHDYPHFLPDGRHFLYMARRGANPEDWDLYVGSMESTDRRRLRGIHAAARYSPTGHLLFQQDNSLMAIAFDPARLEVTGEPFAVMEGLPAGPRAVFTVSQNGALAFLSVASTQESQLAWFDRGGTPITTIGPTGRHERVSVSRDGQMVAFDNAADIFIFDIARGVTSKVVSLDGADVAPVFSPDAHAVVFASSREPATNAGAHNINAGHLYTKPLGLAGEGHVIFRSDAGKRPTDWSRDGRYLAFTSRNDVWALPMPPSADAQPIAVTKTPFVESGARFSPDSKWIAYQSDNSPAGQDIYVQRFPSGRVYAVSVGGGSAPRWSRDGRELFYVSPDSRLMAVPVTYAGDDLEIGKPVTLFESRAFQREPDYDVAANGRFLLKMPFGDQHDNSVAVIVNWTQTVTR